MAWRRLTGPALVWAPRNGCIDDVACWGAFGVLGRISSCVAFAACCAASCEVCGVCGACWMDGDGAWARRPSPAGREGTYIALFSPGRSVGLSPVGFGIDALRLASERGAFSAAAFAF